MKSMIFGFIILISLSIINVVEPKCFQKNTDREANPDYYICKNQYLEKGKQIADPENCECYYDCSFNRQPCYTCCPHGQIFRENRGCVLREAYRCQNQPPKFTCEGIGLFAHEHCRKYWDCHNPKAPVEEACTEDHHWDDFKKICRKDSEVFKSACG